MNRSIYIGWDPREEDAWQVAQRSLLRHLSEPIPVYKLSLDDLRDRRLYLRATKREGGRLIDVRSARPGYSGAISTEHAIARFFVAILAQEGWVLFMDGDVLVRSDITEVFRGLDPEKAVYCVQHKHTPPVKEKMDGQLQTQYARKNWSSFMIINASHPRNRPILSAEYLNAWPGRDYHAFAWLNDHEIGALDPKWNWLVGWSDHKIDPAVVHFTEGTPDMPGYTDCDYADEWRRELVALSRQVAAE